MNTLFVTLLRVTHVDYCHSIGVDPFSPDGWAIYYAGDYCDGDEFVTEEATRHHGSACVCTSCREE